MVTGVDSHASMSEKSRLETLEKTVVHLYRITKEQDEAIKKLAQEVEEVSEELDGADRHLERIEFQLDAHYRLLYQLPQFKKSDSGSSEELSD